MSKWHAQLMFGAHICNIQVNFLKKTTTTLDSICNSKSNSDQQDIQSCIHHDSACHKKRLQALQSQKGYTKYDTTEKDTHIQI